MFTGKLSRTNKTDNIAAYTGKLDATNRVVKKVIFH